MYTTKKRAKKGRKREKRDGGQLERMLIKFLWSPNQEAHLGPERARVAFQQAALRLQPVVGRLLEMAPHSQAEWAQGAKSLQ